MSLSAIGDCQLLSQIYKYKGRRIACSIKVLPTPAPVTHFAREATNDYHWMTAVRWARIEIALYRLFENLAHWRDAKKLREELLVDHINVLVQATEKPYPATISLLAGAELAPEDLCLDIQLQYMTVEDTSIVGMHTTKRKLATEAGANGTVKSSGFSSRSPPAGSAIKPKAGIKEKPIRSKPKHIDADDEDDEDCPTTSKSQPPTKVKRGRRSISHGADIQEENSSTNGSSSRQGKRRSLSAGRNSLDSSGESKVARRSGRSPIRPSRFNNFVLSNTEQKKRNSGKSKEKPSAVEKVKGKPKTASAAKAVKVKPTPLSSPAKAVKKSVTPTPAEAQKAEQMARLDALQRLDSMLTIPKPPEVQILLLENMSEADVLATFEKYRRDFDKLFQERKDKGQTHSYLHVGHMDVMDILNADIRNKMMTKLAESYSTQSRHTSLVINGLLPLWIVLLFTDTYKLSHGDAARQIKDQLRWSSYLKALNNEPLASDLDD